jgi:hypothetical protein
MPHRHVAPDGHGRWLTLGRLRDPRHALLILHQGKIVSQDAATVTDPEIAPGYLGALIYFRR